MAEKTRTVYGFGAFRFDAGERVLYRDASVVPLTPKVADTLLVLLERGGRLVEKSELLGLVWPGTFVEEGGLARNISVLRKALGDEPDGCHYIETVPKRGYRFVAEVSEIPSPPETPDATPALPGRHRPRRLIAALTAIAALLLGAVAYIVYSYNARAPAFRAASIAVLPLKNLSNDPAQEYLSEGMADELATVLAKNGVRVIASNSIRRLRPGAPLDEIGRRLKVEAVVEGTVLGSGDRVRINARLIDVRTGRLVWADSYQRSLRDVLALQSEVAGAIAREIRASVAPGPKPGTSRQRPVVPDAYRAYLHGRFFWNKRTEAGLRKAIESFNEAIALDASYAPAYAGVADSYALLGSNFYDAIPPREAMPLARTAARKALELDPHLAEAHTSLAYVLMVYDWDLSAAEKEFRQAFRSNPGYATAHHWYGHYLLAAGQPEQALAEMKQAQALDPLSLPVNVGVGWCSYFARRYDEAIAQYWEALELEPDFALAHQALAMALERKGAYTEAIAEFRKAVALSGGSAGTLASLGHACAMAGAAADAQAQLDRLEELSRRRYVPAIYRALIYLGLRDKERAAAWLAKAYEERSEYFIYYRLDPGFDPFRSDKRFVPTPLARLPGR
jgi:TolB-like protein/DNA-binding winged helix-turn-helix (wHTH) protein/Tfp pilus assembly protein PilF